MSRSHLVVDHGWRNDRNHLVGLYILMLHTLGLDTSPCDLDCSYRDIRRNVGGTFGLHNTDSNMDVFPLDTVAAGIVWTD